jgi:hypothetical protein
MLNHTSVDLKFNDLRSHVQLFDNFITGFPFQSEGQVSFMIKMVIRILGMGAKAGIRYQCCLATTTENRISTSQNAEMISVLTVVMAAPFSPYLSCTSS